MNRLQKCLIVSVLTMCLMLASSAMTPWVPMAQLALGATPSSQLITATTTSGTTFTQVGWNRLTCSSDVYYKMVAAYDSTVTATTGTLLRGPVSSNGLPRAAWINVASGTQWLAILLKSGTTTTCMVETVSMDGSAGSFTTLAASGATTLSSTLAVTGASTLTGNTTVGGTLGVTGASTLTGNTTVGGTFGVTGATTLSSTLGVTGATTLAAVTATGTNTFTGYTSVADAGINNVTATGDVSVAGSLTNSGDNLIGGGTKTRGRITLVSGTPSTQTATVNTGAFCVCSNETTQANPVKCAVSGTTMTATGPNTVTDSVAYICMQ